ncbi:hypothetical protein [Aliterella atlantica]|uniref:Uncharacterized protein n=1 Tax=Aliterella atlantica CENA595 TaxID=1618023 RepID=A0A0D8ZNZ6_9CYAN|nr:hypothetical protein [Aliterella atlantica]KJH70184.1 hypothetical protein UH38_19515 [Aliterella atlantica CENA595]
MNILNFRGFIRDVVYAPVLIPNLTTYDFNNFNINQSKPFGIISLDSLQNNLAFSQWKSPKRTRTYPFARIYNTYHLNSKKVTIIPIIKDEGADGDNDRLNFITMSWMNLLNVYIILAWYERADRVTDSNINKIKNQKFSNEYINQKLLEISHYQLTALHWNTTHFEKDFETVYLNAVNSYKNISSTQNVKLHPYSKHIEVLNSFKRDGKFSIQSFKESTLDRSLAAARRESTTKHKLEYLSDGYKGVFSISNYLGGMYHLTSDEVYQQGTIFIIQESKNSSSRQMPSEDDIKDGLFKLILFSNLEYLYLDDNPVEFTTRLKLTGKVNGSLHFPNETTAIEEFCHINSFKKNQIKIVQSLNLETKQNSKLNVLITSNV